LMHPAYEDIVGSVPLEALAAGLPSIVTDVCGHSDWIARAEAGRLIAAPFRQDLLNAALVELLSDHALRAAWRRNGVAFGRDADLDDLPEHAARCIVDVAAQLTHSTNGTGAERDRHTVPA